MLSVQSLIREISPARRSGRAPGRPTEDARLREAIDALPDAARLALALRCFEQVPVSAIASVLGVEEERARRLIEEAAETVTRALNRQHEGTEHGRRAPGGTPR
jgi:DNA-directed RNA polymerase specialized sigma24 family protein